MGELSKNMQRALDAVRAMSPEHQDFLAAELMEHARLLALPPTRLSPEERAELEAAGQVFSTETDTESLSGRLRYQRARSYQPAWVCASSRPTNSTRSARNRIFRPWFLCKRAPTKAPST